MDKRTESKMEKIANSFKNCECFPFQNFQHFQNFQNFQDYQKSINSKNCKNNKNSKKNRNKIFSLPFSFSGKLSSSHFFINNDDCCGNDLYSFSYHAKNSYKKKDNFYLNNSEKNWSNSSFNVAPNKVRLKNSRKYIHKILSRSALKTRENLHCSQFSMHKPILTYKNKKKNNNNYIHGNRNRDRNRNNEDLKEFLDYLHIYPLKQNTKEVENNENNKNKNNNNKNKKVNQRSEEQTRNSNQIIVKFTETEYNNDYKGLIIKFNARHNSFEPINRTQEIQNGFQLNKESYEHKRDNTIAMKPLEKYPGIQTIFQATIEPFTIKNSTNEHELLQTEFSSKVDERSVRALISNQNKIENPNLLNLNLSAIPCSKVVKTIKKKETKNLIKNTICKFTNNIINKGNGNNSIEADDSLDTKKLNKFTVDCFNIQNYFEKTQNNNNYNYNYNYNNNNKISSKASREKNKNIVSGIKPNEIDINIQGIKITPMKEENFLNLPKIFISRNENIFHNKSKTSSFIPKNNTEYGNNFTSDIKFRVFYFDNKKKGYNSHFGNEITFQNTISKKLIHHSVQSRKNVNRNTENWKHSKQSRQSKRFFNSMRIIVIYNLEREFSHSKKF